MGKAELNIMIDNLMKNAIHVYLNHYFINDYTELTSYCLENYEEVKDFKESNTICRKKESIMNEVKQVRYLLHLFSYSE